MSTIEGKIVLQLAIFTILTLVAKELNNFPQISFTIQWLTNQAESEISNTLR